MVKKMSNIYVGKILKLFVSHKGNSKRVRQSALLVDTLGVKGDKFYNKESDRSILIASTDSYDLIKNYQIDMPHGYLGENLLIDYNPYALAIGTRLKVGDAVLEISQNCTICNHLSILDKRIPKLLKSDRGIFAKTIKSGEINLDDSIYILQE